MRTGRLQKLPGLPAIGSGMCLPADAVELHLQKRVQDIEELNKTVSAEGPEQRKRNNKLIWMI